jgi:hypothetical protein
MAVYNLMQQNRYLEQKIDMLRSEYEKQTRRIEKYSAKARAHMGCFKECY